MIQYAPYTELHRPQFHFTPRKRGTTPSSSTRPATVCE